MDLVDFETLLAEDCQEIDHARLTIAGKFEDADVELAKAAYKAIAIQE